MASPRALILSGYGLNCEEETLFAFEKAGASGSIIHINDLAESPETLADYQILAVPGGFSFGDDTGSGNAYASRLKNHLWDALLAFIERDTLMIGICNGCQVLANLGLTPAPGNPRGTRDVALLHNASGRYQCRWVDLKPDGNSPWMRGIEHLHIPVAHGEGNFYMEEKTLNAFRASGQIAARYVKPDGAPANGNFPENPNGAMDDIAAVTDASGRVLIMMPHPERAIFFTQREDWPLLKEQFKRAGKPLPEHGDGLKLFENGVRYFQ
ncbi:MAG: phosphoribosylformylglycinamidine synthase subunit PurQ [Alphaproteobacteria bacterium]|nr:phosphoribosylformylglycinamidine synthase subunit PurQ [Alphaproteobacteria bacterium]